MALDLDDRLFAGDTEMARLMRSHDWAITGVGGPETWPLSLRTTVRTMLTSRFAMWMGWGPDLTFFYNDAYGSMTLGAKHPWALGRPARDVWAEIWPNIHPRIDKVLGTGTATWDERLLLFLERSGFAEETYHTFSYSPISDDSGVTSGMLCVVTEETERVIGERRLSRLHDLASRLSSAIGTEDVLRATTASLQDDARDLPFTLTYQFVQEDARPRLVAATGIDLTHPAIRSGEDGAPALWPLHRDRPSGPVRVPLPPEMDWPSGVWERPPTHAVVVPIVQQSQSQPAGVFVAGLNPYRIFDDAYRNFVGLVVGQIGAGLASARAYEDERRRAAALAELDRAKTAFFSNVSHEFRTPLTLMLGPIEDALAVSRPLAGEELQSAHRNMLRLLKLVNTLLDFSRIEAGRAEAAFQQTDLATLTTDLASSFRSALDRAGLVLAVTCDPIAEPTYVDPQMWEKIVLNLLSNAFKFTFSGSIAVTLRSPAPGRVELSVADTGVGIPAEHLPRVFDRFHRVEGALARSHEGSGIGLALVRDLVTLHGGEISVVSRVAEGTTFTVSLPTGRAHLPSEQVVESTRGLFDPRSPLPYVEESLRWLPEPAADIRQGDVTVEHRDGPPIPQARVLVVDDNADMRGYLTRLLQPHWQVEAVGDGAQALAAIARRPPDLVVSDVMMPRLDGFGLVRALRSDPMTRSIPILLLSAKANEEARIEGIRAGADDYLVKPFSARELLAKVTTRLELQLAGRRLEALADEASRANRAKDEFLAMLGHELRNPLAPMLTALQLMRLRGESVFEKERTVIERQARHLVRLVDDLLDVSRIARGKIELRTEPIELGDIVAKAIEMASPLFELRDQQLATDVPSAGLLVAADPARLAQVVANLLTNAGKYTEKGGRIGIAARRDGPDVRLSVTDTGIGISAEMLPFVFDMFAQERQALDRSQGGLGLGLTIARSLMELHGGTIAARSAGPGQGSEFVLRLPVTVTAAEPGVTVRKDRPVALMAPSSDRRRVLVVDDNEDAAHTLADLLARLGHTLRVAHDGPSALRLLDEFTPEVALIDIGLPVMDGYELAACFRRHPALAHVKLVAVTGYGQAVDRALTRAAGFDAHLVKPVDLEVLEPIVREPRA